MTARADGGSLLVFAGGVAADRDIAEADALMRMPTSSALSDRVVRHARIHCQH